MRFLWQRRGLKHPFSLTSLPTITSTSPCRLQPIYYSCVSATIRLSKILVHTLSLAPLPLPVAPVTQAFTTAPVLRHFDPEEPAIVETDASDFALGGILSQKHEGRLHPIASHSQKFTEAEINYDTADKELLAIVDCFKRWRRYLEGAKHQVQVISDHQNLELFQTTKVLIC